MASHLLDDFAEAALMNACCATRWPFLATLLVMLASMASGKPAVGDDGEDDLLAAAQAAAQAEPRAMEMRFNDESRLKFKLLDERIEVSSRYGNLQVPAADIRKIDFALRLSDSTKKQIDSLITELESTDGQVRKAALR